MGSPSPSRGIRSPSHGIPVPILRSPISIMVQVSYDEFVQFYNELSDTLLTESNRRLLVTTHG